MSQRKGLLCSLFSRPLWRGTVFTATCLALAMLFYLPATAAVVYEIHDGENTYRVESSSGDVNGALDEAGVDYSDIDLIHANEGEDVVSVSITRRQYVTVVCDDVSTSMLANTDDTVADVLERMNITLGEFDQISMDPSEVPEAGSIIEIHRATITYRTESTPLPYSSVRTADPEMDRGEEAVTQEGVEGSHNITYRTIEVEGSEPVEEVFSETTIDPVDEVVSYGTKVYFERPTGYSTTNEYITNIDDEAGTFTTSRGDTYTFSGTVTLEATAYTARAGAICSTGRLARVGVVAVDPDYIPYGTEMFIMSADGSFVYGIAVAGDCGGAIDNWDVDLYMTSRSNCINFGRRDVVAYMITGITGEVDA